MRAHPPPPPPFKGKNQRKKTGSRGKTPAGLTARGPWATAQRTKTTARGARAMGHAPRLTRRAAGAEGLVYRVFINQPHEQKTNRPRVKNQPRGRLIALVKRTVVLRPYFSKPRRFQTKQIQCGYCRTGRAHDLLIQ